MLKALVWIVLLLAALDARAQERFSVFVPTEESDVARMLELAHVVPGDVVYDLGSGDGRIVLEAARRSAGVLGRGIEIDQKLVAGSTAAAKAAGLSERVRFIHQNAFDADLEEASVIVMWLWPELMRMLRPKILAEARPGTRVITRSWDLGSWPPDQVDNEGVQLFKWIVPAKVEGYWNWSLPIEGRRYDYAAVIDQRFQTVEGVLRAGSRRAVLDSMKLEGDSISFSLLMTLEGLKTVRHQFSGRVREDSIEGTVTVLYEPYERSVELPWHAQRVAVSPYFAPTGVDQR